VKIELFKEIFNSDFAKKEKILIQGEVVYLDG